jgi:hypothetical protein
MYHLELTPKYYGLIKMKDSLTKHINLERSNNDERTNKATFIKSYKKEKKK